MKLSYVILSMLLSTFNTIPAYAQQGEGGHGGDECENRFRDISRDLLKFIVSDSVNDLQLQPAETTASFRIKAKTRLSLYVQRSPMSDVVMGCTSAPVYVHGVEKTCAWRSPSEDPAILDGKIHIDCNFNRFFHGMVNPRQREALPKNLLSPFQAKHAIHEWLSIANLEPSTDSVSDYFYTDQITSTGGWELEFKLGLNQITPNNTGGSRNYNSLDANEDGTFGISGPRFQSPDGTGNLELDSTSDLTGVCRLYGFDGYVQNSMLSRYSDSRKVAISSNGTFRAFSNSNTITNLSCYRIPNAGRISRYARFTLNDDGSTSVSHPQFSMYGSSYDLDSTSDKGGICRLYGFSQYVDNSIISNYSDKRKVAVDSNAKFDKFANANTITSLICR